MIAFGIYLFIFTEKRRILHLASVIAGYAVVALCISTYAAPSTNLVNDGIRHNPCVSLSDAAEAYYEDYYVANNPVKQI